MDEQQFIFHVFDIIDSIKEFPVIYRVADNQEKNKLLLSYADGLIVDKDKNEIKWKKPFSFILNPDCPEIYSGQSGFSMCRHGCVMGYPPKWKSH